MQADSAPGGESADPCLANAQDDPEHRDERDPSCNGASQAGVRFAVLAHRQEKGKEGRHDEQLPNLDTEIEAEEGRGEVSTDNPRSRSTLLSPNPWMRPKRKAMCARELAFGRKTASSATKSTDAAMRGSTRRAGRVTHPSVASASVTLCAAVNALTVMASWRQQVTLRMSVTMKRMWSYPVKMCRIPSPTKCTTVAAVHEGRSLARQLGQVRAQLGLDEIVVAPGFVGDRDVGEPVPQVKRGFDDAGCRERGEVDVSLDVVATEEVTHQRPAVLEIAHELVRDGHVVGDERPNPEVAELRRADELRHRDDAVRGVVPEEAPERVGVLARGSAVRHREAVEEVQREKCAVLRDLGELQLWW